MTNCVKRERCCYADIVVTKITVCRVACLSDSKHFQFTVIMKASQTLQRTHISHSKCENGMASFLPKKGILRPTGNLGQETAQFHMLATMEPSPVFSFPLKLRVAIGREVCDSGLLSIFIYGKIGASLCSSTALVASFLLN